MLTTDINPQSILCVSRRSLQWHQNVFVEYKKVKYGRLKVDFLQFIYGVGEFSHPDSPLLSPLQPHSHYDTAAASRVGRYSLWQRNSASLPYMARCPGKIEQRSLEQMQF